jgi:hypothetical protein
MNYKERGYEPLLRPPGGGGFKESVPTRLCACSEPGSQSIEEESLNSVTAAVWYEIGYEARDHSTKNPSPTPIHT